MQEVIDAMQHGGIEATNIPVKRSKWEDTR